MKALFDYDPNEDKAIPCKEAALAFKKGSILQIMSQDDATWWQAKHNGETNPRAGLIPSKQFQERYETTSARSACFVYLLTMTACFNYCHSFISFTVILYPVSLFCQAIWAECCTNSLYHPEQKCLDNHEEFCLLK